MSNDLKVTLAQLTTVTGLVAMWPITRHTTVTDTPHKTVR